MSTTCIIGCMDEESELPIKGNGKTTVLVYYTLQEHLKKKIKIISNLHLIGITYTYMSAQQIYDMFMQKEINNTLIIFDELTGFLNNMGVNNKIIMKFVNRFIAQSRKADNETWMTAQRYNDIPRRMRAQIDRILIPVKKHGDGSLCYQDKCKAHHWIEVYSDKPYRKTPISLIDTWVIGKYYDTNEIITDELIG